MGAQDNLEQIRTFAVDAQKLANDLDNFGGRPAVAAKPSGQAKSVGSNQKQMS